MATRKWSNAWLQRKVTRALNALDNLPNGLDLSGALIAIADELDGELEPDPEDLPLFAFAAGDSPAL